MTCEGIVMYDREAFRIKFFSMFFSFSLLGEFNV